MTWLIWCTWPSGYSRYLTEINSYGDTHRLVTFETRGEAAVAARQLEMTDRDGGTYIVRELEWVPRPS
jgi:hypothetical protein